MSDLLPYLVGLVGGIGVGAVLIVGYVLFFPEKAEKLGGWVAGIVANVFKRGHRTAIALKVQGAINTARAELLRNAPSHLIERKLKIKWAKTAEEATSLLREGEVLVVMQRSSHHEENVAQALMAYLPKAMLPRARRYVDPQRMRAADLLVARSVLAQSGEQSGALSAFFDQHLDPAREESEDLKTKITELDSVDLQGWLVRVLLAEYHRLGEQLHPGEPEQTCRQDAEEFAKWLYRLATREPGSNKSSLSYDGRYFRVAAMFVAATGRLQDEGLRPYYRRARRLLWQDKFDAIYLMARDPNIDAVLELAERLEKDVRVEQVARYRYRLRPDFKKRTNIHRDEAVLVCLRRRQGPSEGVPLPDDELPIPGEDDLDDEVFAPPLAEPATTGR